VARKKKKIIYKYQCQITEEWFKTTKEAKNPDDLMSVTAYYDLNAEEDDRPEHIKQELAKES
jgi:hypothetical protein